MTGFSAEQADRRRRLFLLAQLQTRSAVSEPVPEETATVSGAGSAPAPTWKRKRRSFETAIADRATPLAWVFTGEPACGAQDDGPSAPLSGLAGVAIRENLRRQTDAFVDTSSPGLRLTELLQDFDRRVARFRPDILVVGTTTREEIRALKGLPRFERRLIQLTRYCHRRGCEVILMTPTFRAATSAEDEIDRLVYVEATRGIAAEHAIPLVDLWAHGEETGDLSAGGLLHRFLRDLQLERERTEEPVRR